jgi:peroxiredoxin
VGPKIGERFPDIELPDQSGAALNLQEHRGNRRGLVVFHRSAGW